MKPRPIVYPDSRYKPAALVDLSSRKERERLSPSGLKAFFNIMARWAVRDEDARALLGSVSNGPFYEMKRKPDRVLDPDRLTRVSYVIGIFKALNILYSDANPLFGGQTPLAFMIKGGLPAMHTVRRLLDARRAG